MRRSVGFSGLFFGLALLLFSCEESGIIGLDVDSENLRFRVNYIELDVPSSVILTDSIVTQNRARLLVGKIDDPNFGRISTTGYSQLSLSSLSPALDESAEYDSLVLIMGLDYSFGDNYEEDINIEVSRLTEDLADSIVYYSFSSSTFERRPIGAVNFFYVLENSEVNLDTVVRIGINDAIGIDLFDRLKNQDEIFESTANFQEYFKGLVFTTPDEDKVITGFDLADSRMELYYHFTNSNGEVLNVIFEFTFLGSTHYNNITADRRGTPLAALVNPYEEFDAGTGKVYMQNGTGIAPKLDFVEFLAFSDTISNLIINRADLIINPADPYAINSLPPPSSVYYITDDSNRRLVNEVNLQARTIQVDFPGVNQNGTAQPKIIPLDNDILGYQGTISSYLQALYEREIEETEVLMYSEFTDETQSVNRMSIDQSNLKLGIYYTITDQSTLSN